MMINEAHAQATAASGRGDGQYPSGLHDGAEISTAAGGQTKAEVPLTMEAVITRENLMLAYQRVVENKGVAELKPWLKKNWRSVWQVLIDGNYQPRAIRRMDIPKPDAKCWPDEQEAVKAAQQGKVAQITKARYSHGTL